MFTRYFVILACVISLGLGACSTTEDASTTSEDPMVTTTATVEGSDGYAGDGYTQSNLDGPASGTQEDLAVNIGDRVFFGYDRYDLSPEARRILDQQANWLMTHANLNITIEGHADERGTREYNLALGERRASSVENYLIALGVDPRRVNTISYGKERPAVPGADASAWSQNRRAVTRVD